MHIVYLSIYVITWYSLSLFSAIFLFSDYIYFHISNYITIFVLRKNIFACLFSVQNTISLSPHEQVCLIKPILDAVLCWGVPEVFHIARLRSTYKTFFRRARTSRAERILKVCCTPQHGFSTTSKMKKRSVDIIFLCRLEKSEKYFLVNWGIIIEYIH